MSLLRVFLALCNMTWWFGVFFKKKEKIFFLVRMTEIKHDKQIYHCLNMVYISYLSTHCTLIYLSRSPRGLGKQGNSGKISKGTREHESIFREQRNITVQIRRRKHFDIRNKYMLFTGWEVRIGRNCVRGLQYCPRLYELYWCSSNHFCDSHFWLLSRILFSSYLLLYHIGVNSVLHV